MTERETDQMAGLFFFAPADSPRQYVLAEAPLQKFRLFAVGDEAVGVHVCLQLFQMLIIRAGKE